MKTKIIFVDGPDDSGKTTLIQKIKKDNPMVVELNFNKGLNGLLRINTDEQFEILKVLLPSLCRENIYIVDRCYLSNIVYDKVLRNESSNASYNFRDWCKENLNSIEVILDRPHIKEDFQDNLISCNKDQFNDIIDSYRMFGSCDIINNPEAENYIHNQIDDLVKSRGYSTSYGS